MTPTDFALLNGHPHWQQALAQLLAAAEAACQNGPETAREAARQHLEAFRDFPCPFQDLIRLAELAINDLTLSSLTEALADLQALSGQLTGASDARFAADAHLAEPLLRWHLRQAQMALVALAGHQLKHPAIRQQIKDLQLSIGELLSGW